MDKRTKIALIILASFAIPFIIGFFAFYFYSNMSATAETTATTVDSIPIDDDTLIILFTHASDDADGNPVENQIFIQEQIRKGDIPVYSDLDQPVVVSCRNSELLDNAMSALKASGYTNITKLDTI